MDRPNYKDRYRNGKKTGSGRIEITEDFSVIVDPYINQSSAYVVVCRPTVLC